MHRRFTSLVAALWLSACGAAAGIPWEISSVRVFAPLPGSGVSVGYLTIRNQGNEALEIVAAHSPQFFSVEFHESSLDNGIARMRKIDRLEVTPKETLVLAPGGLHLMLQDQRLPLKVGDNVTIVLQASSGASIEFNTRLVARDSEEGTIR